MASGSSTGPGHFSRGPGSHSSRRAEDDSPHGSDRLSSAFLLGDLLQLTSARVACLVRAGSETEALKRIRRNLAQYLIEPGTSASRIVPLAGDLSQPRLGLTEEQFARLAHDVDVIYHNGAQVHFLHPYSTLKPANVLGTQEVLRLAATARLKPVHFVSTLSVLSGLSHGRLAAETDRNETPEWLENGYAQSKWVAERLVWSAMECGIPATIFALAESFGTAEPAPSIKTTSSPEPCVPASKSRRCRRWIPCSR